MARARVVKVTLPAHPSLARIGLTFYGNTDASFRRRPEGRATTGTPTGSGRVGPFARDLGRPVGILLEAAAHLFETSHGGYLVGRRGTLRGSHAVEEGALPVPHDAGVARRGLGQLVDDLDGRHPLDATVHVEHPENPGGVVRGERSRGGLGRAGG